MEYFIMMPDERIQTYKRLDYTVPGFSGDEPFVAFAEFDETEQFPDYFYGKLLFQYFFMASDGLKDILDAYSSGIQAVPVFITDTKQRAQKVYWKINCPAESGKYLFRMVQEKAQYIVVSLELAENILRRQLYGIQFRQMPEKWRR